MTVSKGVTWLFCALLFATLGAGPVAASAKPASPGARVTERLEKDKLRAETRKFETEADNASGLRGLFGELAGPLTAITAIGTIIIGLFTLLDDRRKQRDQERESERQQFETKFSGVLISLGAESEAVRAGAAVSLLTFLDDSHGRFHKEAAMAALANLKVDHPPMIKKLLQRAFEKAMSTGGALEQGDRDLSYADLSGSVLCGLELDGARLDHVNLNGADLRGCRLRAAEGTESRLEGARLSGAGTSLFNARLRDVKARKANFGGAELVNAHLRLGDFQEASFRGALLQAAHLEGAKLQGAVFNGANVADTYFQGATFDKRSLSSLCQAVNAEKAHFDPGTRRRLDRLEQDEAAKKCGPTKGKPNEGPQGEAIENDPRV